MISGSVPDQRRWRQATTRGQCPVELTSSFDTHRGGAAAASPG